ncbi:hypothetical protein EPI10_005736 [Gossypium australe]|uniref:Uncharacterized protein n=1 Tax=Gossypium australe TaxID=47621 RepID=A0A5B6WRQ1_9ROSI|nr:hypothetical protein EPI10_005736 [Gossypium australe]
MASVRWWVMGIASIFREIIGALRGCPVIQSARAGCLFMNKKCVIFGTLIMWAGTKIRSMRFMAKTWGSRFIKFPLLLMALTIEEWFHNPHGFYTSKSV